MGMNIRPPARRALVVGLLASVLSVACGDPVDRAALRAVSGAAAEVQDARTFRMSFSMTMSDVPGTTSGSIAITGRGAFDYRRQAGRMTMDMGSALGNLAPPGSARVDVVFEGLVMYMRMPFLTRLIPGGKPWLKMDLETIGRQAGVDFAALSQMGQSDPTQYLNYLAGASDDVREVGKQTIGGVQTTQYHAELDLQNVLEQVPAEIRDKARASIEALEEALAEDAMPVDVWIDRRGLPRRMSLTYEMKAPESEDTFDIRYSAEISDYGTRVRIKPPPQSLVTDLGQLMQQAGGGLSP
jgi:hypothetical protein